MADSPTPPPAEGEARHSHANAAATAPPSGGPGAAAGGGGGPANAPQNQLPADIEGVADAPAPAAGPGAPGGPGAGPAPGGASPAAPAGPADGAPAVVPIEGGKKDDLLNPEPGAPGQASKPAGAEAASADGPRELELDEQRGEQEVSFGGGGGGGRKPQDDGGDSSPAPREPAPVAEAAPAAPAAPAEPVAAAPDPVPRVRDEPDDRHVRVSLDPVELAEFARMMGRSATDYREVASAIRAGESTPQPAELTERMRAARLALEALADELDASGRDLELRAGMIDELTDMPGVRDADVVSTVFGMKVKPLGEEP